MSELINNRQMRQEKLKELILRLHDGASVEEVQADFQKLTNSISPTEITQMEQALVDEGMPVSDIQKLCDVHASVFKGAIEDIHKDDAVKPGFEEGHPIHTLKAENKAIQVFVNSELLPNLEKYIIGQNNADKKALAASFSRLAEIDKHYARKENLIFPIMESNDITAPPQVMWGVDDEIRADIKALAAKLNDASPQMDDLKETTVALTTQIEEMIFKEEEIMIPMVLEVFTEKDWAAIEGSSSDFGFTLIEPPKRWAGSSAPSAETTPKSAAPSVSGMVAADSQTKIKFDAGSLTSEEVNAILNTVPLDMTFVGADDKVRYFTQGKERVFERPLTIIGRQVKHCHPPKSVHVVEGIVADLKSGKKDNEDFWLKMGDMFVYIRYFAVRSKKGEYLGVLEVTQNIKHIVELEGEKRLVE